MNKRIDHQARKDTGEAVHHGIKRLLVGSGLTMDDVIERFGGSRGGFYGKLAGKAPLEYCEIAQIARIFDKTAQELLKVGDPDNRLVDVIVRLREMGIEQGELFEMASEERAA